MVYIKNSSNDPAYNIALEEYAFKKLRKQEKIFLLWRNRPAIIVGKYQNTIEEINSEYVDENNIDVVRRISGGGAVYHDLNNLNFTIISNEEGNENFNFKKFSIPVINTLAKLGVEAKFTGRNDLEIDGKKICGNAQAYVNGRVMHHGCLLFNVDLSVLSKALKVSKDKIESKGVKSVRARVTNILNELPEKIEIETFMDLILDEMKLEYPDIKEYVLNEEDKKEIEKIKKEKFANWDWVYGKSPEYNIEKKSKFAGGKIDVYMDIKESIIKSIKIYGDFFGREDISELENKLIGVKYEKNSISSLLENIEIEKYFSNMTKDNILDSIIS